MCAPPNSLVCISSFSRQTLAATKQKRFNHLHSRVRVVVVCQRICLTTTTTTQTSVAATTTIQWSWTHPPTSANPDSRSVVKNEETTAAKKDRQVSFGCHQLAPVHHMSIPDVLRHTHNPCELSVVLCFEACLLFCFVLFCFVCNALG